MIKHITNTARIEPCTAILFLFFLNQFPFFLSVIVADILLIVQYFIISAEVIVEDKAEGVHRRNIRVEKF
jgi:hypothetical protein